MSIRGKDEQGRRKKLDELLHLIRMVSFELLSTFLPRLFTTREDVIRETKKKERIVLLFKSIWSFFSQEKCQYKLDDLHRM